MKYAGSIATPPRKTRNDATAGDGRFRIAIFPAMKLSAHSVTTTSTATAMALRLGPMGGCNASSVASFTSRSSNEFFRARGERVDEIHLHVEADAGPGGHGDRAAVRHHDFRLDDVFDPVTLAGRDVSRQREVGQCRERDVVRATDAGF